MQQASSSTFAGHSAGLRARPFTCNRVSRGSLQVHSAISRQKKEGIVDGLKQNLQDSVIVFGFRFKGLDVPTMQQFRKGLPGKSKVVVTKNSLMRVACQDVPGWTPVVDKGCSGENAWVFVNEDDIADSIKHYFAFSDGLDKAAKAAAPKGVEAAAPVTLSCVVMDNKFLTPAELKRCEALPTKKQLYATIARLVKQPAQKLAVGINMVPRKLAYGVKALADLDEDKSRVVVDVAQPKAA